MSIIHSSSVLVVVFLATFLSACSCGPPSGEGERDGGPAPTADDAYGAGYDEEDLLTFPQGEGLADLQFPRNQLVVLLQEGTTRAQLMQMLDEVGATVIGQIPTLRLYQVAVDTTTEEELRDVRGVLAERDETEEVSYNFLLTQAGAFEFDTCPVGPDNRKLYDEEHVDPMDALSDVYTALEIVSGLRGAVPMRPVTIGLVEKGILGGGGEFDDTRIEHVGVLGSDDDDDLHGNAVTGLVCADNDKHGVNGIASAFLWDKLSVAIARPIGNDLHSYALALALLAPTADVVANTWFAYLSPDLDERLGPRHAEGRRTVAYVLQVMPQVFFVNAAPNGAFRLTERNAYPAGIRLSNTLTVGATFADSPTRLPETSFGELIDISAPGEDFYVLSGEPGAFVLVPFGEGSTSLATPQVASAAAMLLSLGGDLNHEKLMRYLLEYVGSEGTTGPVQVSGEGGVLLNYARSLNDLLWDRHRERDWAFLLDSNENEVVDTPASVAFDLCVDFNFEVEAVGQFFVAPHADCFGREQTILLSEDGSIMAMMLVGYDDGNSRWASLALSQTAPTTFAVDTPYDLGEETGSFLLDFGAFTDRDGDCAADYGQPGDVNAHGIAIAGSFEFTNCRVLERTAAGKAKYLLVDLGFSGKLDLGIDKFPGEPELIVTSARGWLRSLVVHPAPPTGTFDPHIDAMCSGAGT